VLARHCFGVLSGPEAVTCQHAPCEEAAPAQAKVVVENVSKIFVTQRRSVEALANISLRVNNGQFVCLVGRSGCGKSTLLNIIAGLEPFIGLRRPRDINSFDLANYTSIITRAASLPFLVSGRDSSVTGCVWAIS
jgi:ABC-type glutathione transport system ATPase component